MQVTDANVAEFHSALLNWWTTNARDFPWRNTRDPYAVAIAELMLRRTRAVQVVDVYDRFLRAYPTLGDAAKADTSDLLRILRPLGLQWRAQNVIDFVTEAHEKHPVSLPTTVSELKELPGVGEYVSAAIACFAGGKVEPLIDVNVVRVLGRKFGLDYSGEARRRRKMRELARAVLNVEQTAKYHYAILDLAATVCTARSPKCSQCPFAVASNCSYFNSHPTHTKDG
jgi:A/G-specific adenine glycosylase